jgi:pimeloyl-ACP methyl ester carboxylesterase
MSAAIYAGLMSDVNHMKTPQGRSLAFAFTPGNSPTVVFLSGFRSDMTGTKAQHLEAWAKARGQAFLRFDYSGHGASGGRFEDGTIGDWAEDAQAMVEGQTSGPIVLVGSSMGGWMALLLAKRLAARVTGLVTIAAAPDFTDAMRANLSPLQAAGMKARGRVQMPSAYGESYILTRRFFEEAKAHFVLPDGLNVNYPVRFLQGTADDDVPAATALTVLDRVTGPDVRLTLVQGADHRFSTPECLTLITRSLEEVLSA